MVLGGRNQCNGRKIYGNCRTHLSSMRKGIFSEIIEKLTRKDHKTRTNFKNNPLPKWKTINRITRRRSLINGEKTTPPRMSNAFNPAIARRIIRMYRVLLAALNSFQLNHKSILKMEIGKGDDFVFL